MQTILIAFSLAMDAFTVSLSSGIALNNTKRNNNGVIKDMFRFGICFGLFQFFMPLAGYLLADTLKEQIQKYDYIVAFILLNSVGLNMIFSKQDDDYDVDYNNSEDDYLNNKDTAKDKFNDFKRLITLGIATSIDAFAVGVSFYALKINIIEACIIIGLVAFIMSFLGVYIGSKLSEKLEGKFSSHTEKLGGFILIFIAFKVLINKFI